MFKIFSFFLLFDNQKLISSAYNSRNHRASFKCKSGKKWEYYYY